MSIFPHKTVHDLLRDLLNEADTGRMGVLMQELGVRFQQERFNGILSTSAIDLRKNKRTSLTSAKREKTASSRTN